MLGMRMGCQCLMSSHCPFIDREDLRASGYHEERLQDTPSSVKDPSSSLCPSALLMHLRR